MTSLTNHPALDIVKMLIVGDPGTGKTGSLASLPPAGYNLRILNFDRPDGLRPILKFMPAKFRSQVDYVNCSDKIKVGPKRIETVGRPNALNKATDLLDKGWKYTDDVTGELVDLGYVSDWGPKEVLVLDSLTSMGRASMRRTLALNVRVQKGARKSDWGQAIDIQDGFCEKLCSDDTPCNVVVISHLTLLTLDDKDDDDVTQKPINAFGSKKYPSALGNKLPQKIGQHFDVIVEARLVGSGTNVRRILTATPRLDLDLRASVVNLPKEFPLDVGLVQLFEQLKG